TVRIYEAPDVMNISHWSIQYEINVGKSVSCITWNPSLYRHTSAMLAIGCDDTSIAGQKISFYEFNEQARDWQRVMDKGWPGVFDQVHDIAFAPNVGRSFDLLGAATNKEVKIIAIRM